MAGGRTSSFLFVVLRKRLGRAWTAECPRDRWGMECPDRGGCESRLSGWPEQAAPVVWLGLGTRTQESYVDTPSGVVRTWTFKRTNAQGWNGDAIFAVRGTTRQPDPRREGEHVQIRIETDRDQAGPHGTTSDRCVTGRQEVLCKEERRVRSRIYAGMQRGVIRPFTDIRGST